MHTLFKKAYIDHTGKAVIDANDYQSFRNFSEGLAAVESKKGFWGFIDKTGAISIARQFHQVSNFSEELAAVETFGRWGYIDKTGHIIIDTDYEQLYDFSEDVAVTRKGKELFLIEKTGGKILSLNKDEIQLEFAGNQKFSEGLIVACDNKTWKYGFMDKTGKFVLEPKFEDAGPFSEGVARVLYKQKLGFINHDGEFVIPPKFDLDGEFRRNSTDISEGVASLIDMDSPAITEDSVFMYIDKTGEIILRTTFFRAEPFHEGLAVVYDAEKDMYGFIDKSGELVLPLQYYSADGFSEGLSSVVISI